MSGPTHNLILKKIFSAVSAGQEELDIAVPNAHDIQAGDNFITNYKTPFIQAIPDILSLMESAHAKVPEDDPQKSGEYNNLFRQLKDFQENHDSLNFTDILILLNLTTRFFRTYEIKPISTRETTLQQPPELWPTPPLSFQQQPPMIPVAEDIDELTELYLRNLVLAGHQSIKASTIGRNSLADISIATEQTILKAGVPDHGLIQEDHYSSKARQETQNELDAIVKRRTEIAAVLFNKHAPLVLHESDGDNEVLNIYRGNPEDKNHLYTFAISNDEQGNFYAECRLSDWAHQNLKGKEREIALEFLVQQQNKQLNKVDLGKDVNDVNRVPLFLEIMPSNAPDQSQSVDDQVTMGFTSMFCRKIPIFSESDWLAIRQRFADLSQKNNIHDLKPEEAVTLFKIDTIMKFKAIANGDPLLSTEQANLDTISKALEAVAQTFAQIRPNQAVKGLKDLQAKADAVSASLRAANPYTASFNSVASPEQKFVAQIDASAKKPKAI